MKFNAHKNLGEVLERINMFMDAKSHYTKALRISEKDSFIWTRLGFLEYDKL
jgi:tetratricopeptide (TPR) repeat protein